MKKVLFFCILTIATIGNAFAALTLKTACDGYFFGHETSYHVCVFNTGSTQCHNGYILYDGACPSGYLKVTEAKSMMESPALIAFLYAPANTEIYDDHSNIFKFSSPTPTSDKPSNVCVVQ